MQPEDIDNNELDQDVDLDSLEDFTEDELKALEVFAEAIMNSQESANEEKHMWEEMYGFAHTCTCGEDSLLGLVELVPACYVRLTQEALDACRAKNAALRAIAEGEIEDPRGFASEFILG